MSVSNSSSHAGATGGSSTPLSIKIDDMLASTGIQRNKRKHIAGELATYSCRQLASPSGQPSRGSQFFRSRSRYETARLRAFDACGCQEGNCAWKIANVAGSEPRELGEQYNHCTNSGVSRPRMNVSWGPVPLAKVLTLPIQCDSPLSSSNMPVPKCASSRGGLYNQAKRCYVVWCES